MSPRTLPVAGALVAMVTFCIYCQTALAHRQTLMHHRMSIEELRNTFQVDSHSSVPEYQVIHVRSLNKRHATDDDGGKTKEVHLSAFGRDFRLRLQRNEHLSKSADRLKVYTAEMHADGNLNLTEVTFPDNSSEIGEVYQDDASGAAVLLHHAPDGTILLDGTIGSNLAIKPAPPNIRNKFQQHFRSTTEPDDEIFLDNELPKKSTTYKPELHDGSSSDNTEKQNMDDPPFYTVDSASKGMHIVYHRKPEDSSTFSDYMFMEPDRVQPEMSRSVNNTTATIRQRRAPRDAPMAVWPEILVIVDYDTYNMHGGNNMDIKRYFISFWNGVDLRYKLLGGPKVRISLAGIIISKGRDATPYLENNRVGGNAVDSAGALTELGKYLYRERRLPTYDIAVVVTKLDICRRRQSGVCRRGTAGWTCADVNLRLALAIRVQQGKTLGCRHQTKGIGKGFAYVGGACVVNKRLEKVNSVAIIEDTGGFSGIIVAAHEVGHLLGAVHDGSPPPSYLGGPGAEHCRWEDGYIMSDLRHTERGFKWSICSTQQFKHFLNGDTAKCLYNIPHEDDELPRLLPGKLLSLDAQCRKDRGTSACFKDDRVCAQLFCFDSRSGYCVSYRPAAEGSPCGDGQYCINGRCVPENENVIPDFSRVSEVTVPKPSDIPQSVSSESDVGNINDDEIHSREYPELARLIVAPLKRTAVLDNEDEISIVSRNGKAAIKDNDELQKRTLKRTSVLDSDEDSVDRLDSNSKQQMVQFQSHRDSSASDYKTTSLDDESEVLHMRRTSHLDEVEGLSFPDDQTTRTTRRTSTPQIKTGLYKSQIKDADESSDCGDVMNKLAGGLTCKEFLRRYGDRYCNNHYIITNCCSSRKTVCHA